MNTTKKQTLLAMAGFLAVALVLPSAASADSVQSISANPEVPAGANPQPNGNNGNNGTPEANSAVPEVPAGANPQPNGN